jgi:hypothetical protein
MRGWVYILSNESLPGMVKVGYTSKDPEGRAKELSGDTGVPTPFVVEYEILIEDAHRCEQNIHQFLTDKRVNERREFFRCSLNDAIEAVRFVAGDKLEFEKRLHEDASKSKSTVCHELIGMIRYLMEDGEVTNHEVYHLCEWLNEHPESCDLWPGTELVNPLSEIYQDGVLTHDELSYICDLFQKIDEEFKAKHEDETNTDEDGGPILNAPDLVPPVLASSPPPANLQSRSDSTAPARVLAHEREGLFGGLLQRMEQMKLDWAWRNRLEEFEEGEKKRKRQEFISNVIRRIKLGENIFRPVGILVRGKENICWAEPANLIEEVTRGPRGHRYKDNVQVDQGKFYITSERLIFKGNAKSFDTRIEQLLSVDINIDCFIYSIQNRSKKKMLEFPNGNGDVVCAVLNHLGSG